MDYFVLPPVLNGFQEVGSYFPHLLALAYGYVQVESVRGRGAAVPRKRL